MGKATVSEARGLLEMGRRREMKQRKERRESNKYFISVFKHWLSNTQWKMPLDGLYFGLESEANSM